MPMQTTYTDSPANGIAGQLACRYNDAEIASCYNAEASAEVAFGTAVKWGSATDQKAVKVPAAETDKIKGVVVHSHAYENGENGELGTTGVQSGGKLEVLRHGEIWVIAEDGCAPGDRAWVRCTAGGAGELVGGFPIADEGTETIDTTSYLEFQTYAAAGGLAKLRCRF